MADAPGPLHGLRVIDAATLVAGPLAATNLGEFGAEVIKVEQPGSGDPMRTWGDRKDGIALVWKSVSRNKKCVTLDLRRPGSECSAASGPTATRTTAPRSCAPSCASAAR